MPATIAAAVQQRLDRVSPAVVETLRVAAVVGRTFTVPFVAHVQGQEQEQIEAHVLAACRLHFLEPVTGLSYRFRHDKVRECLLRSIPPLKLRRLHGLAGWALEHEANLAGAALDSQTLADLAFHFTHSGDRARGALYARRAGELALASYAFEEAMQHFGTALLLLAADDPAYGDMLHRQGEAALLAGQEQTALAAFDAATDWFKARGDKRRAARAAHQLGRAYWRLEALAEARLALEDALRLFDCQSEPDVVDVLVDLATLLGVSLLHHQEGLAYAEQAQALAQQLENDRLMAKALRTQGNLLVRDNRLRQGIALLEHALALATQLDDPLEGAECCACLTMAYLWDAQIDRLHELMARQQAFVRRSRDLFQLRHLYSNRSVFLSMQGRQDEALQAFAQAEEIVSRLHNPEAQAFLQLIAGYLALLQGDLAAAEQSMAAGIAQIRAIAPDAVIWYLGLLGLTRAKLGHRGAAQACRQELELLMEKLPAGSMPTGEPLAHLALIALALDDTPRLLQLAPRLEPFAGQFHDSLVDRLLGVIAVRRRQWAEAKRYLTAAEMTARRERMPLELAETLAAQAELAAARPQLLPSPSDRLIEEAAALAEQAGNPTRAAELRAGFSTSGGQALLPAGLTPREVEVLRLVALGRTNRQIAQELVITEKTVEKHLSAIYSKTGADNRAAATAFAYQHRLAAPPAGSSAE